MRLSLFAPPSRRHCQWRTSGFKIRPIRGGREAGQRIVRPLFIVSLYPFGTDLADLIERVKDISIQHFRAIRPIEPLDKGILIRFPGLDVPQFDPWLGTPGECRDHGRIPPCPIHEWPIVRRPTHAHRTTGPLNRKAVHGHEMRDALPPLSRP